MVEVGLEVEVGAYRYDVGGCHPPFDVEVHHRRGVDSHHDVGHHVVCFGGDHQFHDAFDHNLVDRRRLLRHHHHRHQTRFEWYLCLHCES